jgi:hypothetical protein
LAIFFRPVCARASRSACRVASEPELQNVVISAPGTESTTFSANSVSPACGRAYTVPFISVRITEAVMTSGE